MYVMPSDLRYQSYEQRERVVKKLVILRDIIENALPHASTKTTDIDYSRSYAYVQDLIRLVMDNTKSLSTTDVRQLNEIYERFNMTIKI